MTRRTHEEDFIGFDDLDSDDHAPQQQTQVQPTGPPPTGKRKLAEANGNSEDEPYHAKAELLCIYHPGVGQLPPWLSSRTAKTKPGSMRNVHRVLHNEVVDFVNYVSPTPEEHQLRLWAVERIRRVVNSLWPSGELKVFGSFTTKLYLPHSDLDLVILTGESGDKDVCLPHLNRLSRALLQARAVEDCTVISKARIPIIKAVEGISKFHIDISFNQPNGAEAVEIIRRFQEEDWPVSLRSLLFLIKQFLYQRGLNEVYSGGLGSYALINMITSFLQLHPRIRSGQIDPAENLGVLLMEFFELYGKTFRYRTTGIKTSHPPGYFDKRNRSFFQPGRPFALCIEDPQDPTNDISQGTFGIARIRSCFGGALDMLTGLTYKYRKFVDRRHELDRIQRLSWSEPKHIDIQELLPADQPHPGRGRDSSAKAGQASRVNFMVSFLAPVVRLDARSVQRRKEVGAIFESGAMQRALGVTVDPLGSPVSEVRSPSPVNPPGSAKSPPTTSSSSRSTENSAAEAVASPKRMKSQGKTETKNGKEASPVTSAATQRQSADQAVVVISDDEPKESTKLSRQLKREYWQAKSNSPGGAAATVISDEEGACSSQDGFISFE